MFPLCQKYNFQCEIYGMIGIRADMQMKLDYLETQTIKKSQEFRWV